MNNTISIEEASKHIKEMSSCDVCGHVRTCAIYRAISPMINNGWTEGTKPLEPERLAEICGEFVWAQLIKALKTP